MLERPAVIALNKIDLAAAEEVDEMTHDLVRFGLPVVAVSALEGHNLEAFGDTLFSLLPERTELEPVAAEPEKVVVDHLRVERHASGQGWVLKGKSLEEVVARFDATNRDAVAYLQNHFSAAGVHKLLKAAGAEDGDDVFIGEAAFEYFDEQGSQGEVESKE
jgi:GTP-binding protein